MALGQVLDPRTAERVESEIFKRGVDVRGGIFRVLLQVALLITLLTLAVLLVDVVRDGWPVLSTRFGDFINGTLRSRSNDPMLGISQGLRGSLWIALIVAVLAFPVGIGSAIYLEEYAPKNRFTSFIELNIRNLAGVPSVVYGLLGLGLLVGPAAGFTGGRSVLSAGLTMSCLVLPIVIITASEAIRAVPDALREAGFGVGATKWEVVRDNVLPYAAPGVLTGTLLSLSRALGEAAPLILVGAVQGRLGGQQGWFDPAALREKFTGLPIIIFNWVQDGGRDPGFVSAAAAAIIMLLIVVLVLNSAAILLRNYFENKRG